MTALRLALLLTFASAAASPALASSPSGAGLDDQATTAGAPAPADTDTDAAPSGLVLPAVTAPVTPVLAESNTRPSRGTGAASDDSVIITEVKRRLEGDPRMESTDIRVDSVNGTVVLTGSTSSDEARQAAEEIALQVEGVTRVENHLSSPSSANTIKQRSEETLEHTERVASDGWITTKIRSSLLADPITKSMNIGVKTMQGVVSLSGRVASQAEYDRAVQLTNAIKGVKRVNAAELKIEPAE